MTNSSNLPTPTNPLVLTYKGHIPSLKNRRQPKKVKGKDGSEKLLLVKNADVQRYLQGIKETIEAQWRSSGFSMIEKPLRVGLWVRIVFYRASKLLPTSDGDNAYTTLQETLQKLVVENDNQVGSVYFEVKYTGEKHLEHAKVYLWAIDETQEPFEQQLIFYWTHVKNHPQIAITPLPALIKQFMDELK